MKRKLQILLALTLSAGMLFAGCGSSGDSGAKSTDKTTINISLHQDPPKLDPRISTAFVERHVFQSVFDKLVDLDTKGNIVPQLAEKWEISPDGLKYVLHLRKDVKFHDGTEFNAEAVKANLEAYKSKGSNRANELKTVEKITVTDTYTLELALNKAYSPLLSILADRAGMMRSPAAVEKLGDKFMGSPVGTGPYMFKERIKGNKIVLVKNPNYWQAGVPKTDNLVYKIIDDANVALVNLKSGQLDMTNRFPLNEANSFKDNKQIAVINEPGPGFKGYVLNNRKAQFKDKRVRQAMDKAVDREALIKVSQFGVGTPGRTALSPTNFAYEASLDKPGKPDVEGAKKLLAEAGMEKGFKFTLLIDTDPATQQIAQQVQNMLKAVNIEMVIEKQDFGTVLDRAKKGDFEAASIGWSGRVDPDGNIYDWLYTGANMNYMGYSNPQMDKMLDEARSEVNTEKRKAIYKDIMALALEDAPYLYLFHENNVFGLSREVKGFVPSPDGMIHTVNMTKK